VCLEADGGQFRLGEKRADQIGCRRIARTEPGRVHSGCDVEGIDAPCRRPPDVRSHAVADGQNLAGIDRPGQALQGGERTIVNQRVRLADNLGFAAALLVGKRERAGAKSGFASRQSA